MVLLRYAYPIYWDGAGPMPSFFYSGHLPSITEYYNHKARYDAVFLFPYVVAALLIVIITCFIAPRLAKVRSPKRIVVFAVALSLLLAAAAANDLVVRILNNGWLLLAAADSVFAFLVVATAMAALSAAFADS